MGGELSMFWNLPSLLIVLPPAVLFAVSATSWQTMQQSIGAITTSKSSVTSQHIRFYNVLGNSAMWMGLLGLLVGLMSIGFTLNAQNASQLIGMGTGVSLLTLLYAMMLKMLCYVVEQKLQNQLSIHSD